MYQHRLTVLDFALYRLLQANPGMSFPHQVPQPTCLGWGIWLVQSLPGKVRPHLTESFWGCLVLLWPGAVVKVILELKKSKSIKNQVIQHMTLKILLCIIQTSLNFCPCHLHIIKISKLFRWQWQGNIYKISSSLRDLEEVVNVISMANTILQIVVWRIRPRRCSLACLVS